MRAWPCKCESVCASADIVKLIFILADIQYGSCASFSADNARRDVIICIVSETADAALFRALFYSRGLKEDRYAGDWQF